MASHFQKLKSHAHGFFGQKGKHYASKFAKNAAKHVLHNHGIPLPGLG